MATGEGQMRSNPGLRFTAGLIGESFISCPVSMNRSSAGVGVLLININISQIYI